MEIRFNDTNREKLQKQLNTQNKSLKRILAASNLCLHNQLKPYNSIVLQMFLNKVSLQIDRKWMAASFDKFYGKVCELVFVLTQENAYSQRFHLKANRKSIGSSQTILRIFKN